MTNDLLERLERWSQQRQTLNKRLEGRCDPEPDWFGEAAARIRELTEKLRKREKALQAIISAPGGGPAKRIATMALENAAAQDGQTPPLTAGVTSAASQEAQAAGPASAASSIRELEKQLEDQSNELSDARSGERKLIVQLEAERKARDEAERKLLDRTQWSEGDFDDKGISLWDLSPHYENAVSELTRRKAYAKSDCAQMIAEGWKAAETAEARVATVSKLAQFGALVLEESRDSLGDLDGGWLQDKAEEIGILTRVEVTEPCSEYSCRCAEYGDFPIDCLRYSEEMAAAIRAMK